MHTLDTIAAVLGYCVLTLIVLAFLALVWNLLVGMLVGIDIMRCQITLAMKDPAHNKFKLAWLPGLIRTILRYSYEYSNWRPSDVDGVTITSYSKDHKWYGTWNGYKNWTIVPARQEAEQND